MSAPPTTDHSADSLFDSFDTPPRLPHLSGSGSRSRSTSSSATPPPAPSRPRYGRVIPSRSTTTRTTPHDRSSPIPSSPASSTHSDLMVRRSPRSLIRSNPLEIGPPNAQASTPPEHSGDLARVQDAYEDTYDEDSRSIEDRGDHSFSGEADDDDDDDDNDDDEEEPEESEESESELSILHKIGLIPSPSTLPFLDSSSKSKSKLVGDEDEVDQAWRTSWMGPREVKGSRMGPRLIDRGVGFDGVDHQTHRTIIDHQLASTSFLFSSGPYLDRPCNNTIHTGQPPALTSGSGSRMDGRKGLRMGRRAGMGGWTGTGGRFGVGVLPRGG